MASSLSCCSTGAADAARSGSGASKAMGAGLSSGEILHLLLRFDARRYREEASPANSSSEKFTFVDGPLSARSLAAISLVAGASSVK